MVTSATSSESAHADFLGRLADAIIATTCTTTTSGPITATTTTVTDSALVESQSVQPFSQVQSVQSAPLVEHDLPLQADQPLQAYYTQSWQPASYELDWSSPQDYTQPAPDIEPDAVEFFLVGDATFCGQVSSPPATDVQLDNLFTGAAELCEPITPNYRGSYLRVGPYEVRPAIGYEVPLGRGYQPVLCNSVSRLAGYLGRDEYSMYIREAPVAPSYGVRPSKNGVWIRQPFEHQFRRLEAGEAERISFDTDIRLGGNGEDGESGFRVYVL